MTGTHSTPILSQRARSLLKLLVGHYIKTGSPVGSRTLASYPSVDLSPASIRHVLAELEKEELICSLHTSSGRIPTAKGYRFFVEQLLTIRPIRKNEIELYKEQFDRGSSPEEAVKAASSLLSSLTHLVGLVMSPRQEQYVVEGQINLVNCLDISDIQKLRELLSILERKQIILELLEYSMTQRGLQVLIEHRLLSDFAFVIKPYFVNGEMVGALGIVGPTRMAYDKVIPMVNLTARVLGAVLER